MPSALVRSGEGALAGGAAERGAARISRGGGRWRRKKRRRGRPEMSRRVAIKVLPRAMAGHVQKGGTKAKAAFEEEYRSNLLRHR
jgi:hypothetical protein